MQSREDYILQPPKILEYSNGIKIEYSVHSCPPKLQKEFLRILPDEKHRIDNNEFYIVPTWQPTKVDLTGLGAEVQDEKDEKLDSFMEWGIRFTKRSKQHGYWSDLLDPASGLPHFSRASSFIYNELEGMTTLLGYPVNPVGTCFFMFHPIWKAKSYPATLITTTPPSLISHILDHLYDDSNHVNMCQHCTEH